MLQSQWNSNLFEFHTLVLFIIYRLKLQCSCQLVDTWCWIQYSHFSLSISKLWNMILIKYRLVDRPLFQGNGSLMRIHTRKDLFSHQKEHRCYCLFSLHIQSIVCMEFVCVQMKVSQVLLQFHRYTFSNSVCGVLKVWTNWAHYCAQELNRYHQMKVTLQWVIFS